MGENKNVEAEVRPRREIEWFVMLFHLHLHVFGLYSIFIALVEARFATLVFASFTIILSLLGVTAGAHRLWAHRTYTASWPLRLFLMLCQTSAGVGSIYDWVLNHRLHHKHKDTDNDPFNHKRGFFYSHFLSHMYSCSSNYEELVKDVDMSDIENDRIVMIQKRIYWLLMPILTFLIPINAPIEYWGESVLNSVCVMGVLRYAIALHLAWLVNSSLLLWGLKAENNFSADTNWIFVVNLSFWPHYHYLLPWDYQTGEYGNYGSGITTSFIRVCYALGWATGLKTIDSQSVKKAVETSVKSDKPLLDCLVSEGEKYSESLKQSNVFETPDHF